MQLPGSAVLDEGRLPNGAYARVVRGDALDAGQLAEVLALLQASFNGAWPGFELEVSPLEHLAWKLAGAADHPSYLTLVETDGRLVAMAITMRERTLVGGQEFMFEGGGDACTHPDYERRGMYSQRREFEAGNIETWLAGSLTASSNPSVIRQRERRGDPDQPGAQPRIHVRVFNAQRLARRRRATGSPIPATLFAAAVAPLQAYAVASSRLRAGGSQSLSLFNIDQFDQRFDDLFGDAATVFEYIKVRSADYLNWRYADLRGGRYTKFAVTEGDELVGYIVLKISRDTGQIMDVLVRPGRLGAASALVRRAADELRAAGVATGMAWLPRSHPYRSVFRRHGFLDFRSASGVSVQPYTELSDGRLAFLEQPNARVHLMLGDLDGA